MNSTKIECLHFDTCTPDYFAGSDLPYLAVDVDSSTTKEELKDSLIEELKSNNEFEECCEEWLLSVEESIRSLNIETDLPFSHLEANNYGDCDAISAYFLLIEKV